MTTSAPIARFKPAIIVLAIPGVSVAPGSQLRRCFLCTEQFPAAPETLATVEEFRQRRAMFLVLCHSCYVSIKPRLAPWGPGTAVGIDTARKIYGMNPIEWTERT